MTSHAKTKLQSFLGTFGVVAGVLVLSMMFSTWKTAAIAKTAHSFVQTAAIANEFEIESSQIALKKSQNDEIKHFAQHMVDDHTKTAQELSDALASPDAGVSGPDAHLDAKHQLLLNRLKKASGKNFDILYVKDQVAAHDDAVKLFGNYASNGSNQTLKDFAAKTLPTLQSHQQDIDKIQAAY